MYEHERIAGVDIEPSLPEHAGALEHDERVRSAAASGTAGTDGGWEPWGRTDGDVQPVELVAEPAAGGYLAK